MAELMRLPDTELEIMKVIWESGRTLSTSEVKASLEEQRPWNVSALQTLLNRLIDRGFLESYKEGKNRFYTGGGEGVSGGGKQGIFGEGE